MLNKTIQNQKVNLKNTAKYIFGKENNPEYFLLINRLINFEFA